MTPSLKSSRGMTLVETLIVIAFTVVMLFGLARFYVAINSSFGFDRTLITVASSAGLFVNAAEADIRAADFVLASQTISGTPYSSSASTLVLSLPSVDASGNVVANAHDYVAFYKTGANVYRVLSANASSARISGTKTLGTTVTSLSFVYDSGTFTQVSKVTIDIQASGSWKQKTASQHLTEQVSLRNH